MGLNFETHLRNVDKTEVVLFQGLIVTNNLLFIIKGLTTLQKKSELTFFENMQICQCHESAIALCDFLG